RKVIIDPVPYYIKELLDILDRFGIKYSIDDVLKSIKIKAKVEDIRWRLFTVLELTQGKSKLIQLKVGYTQIEITVADLEKDRSESVLMPNDYQVDYFKGYLYVKYKHLIKINETGSFDPLDLR
ncbi:MAG: hypothetical protein JHC26_05160, partial [Thermofilum sp.]|uniref:hypothetical protein n=1 Tax=Thermofilum sp. TaxID=1961369 RepID=UPI0025905360